MGAFQTFPIFALRVIIEELTNTKHIMKKKFICAVCGYIYEGAEAPEKCPICKAPASKFSELKENGETTYATVHKIGDGKLPAQPT